MLTKFVEDNAQCIVSMQGVAPENNPLPMREVHYGKSLQHKRNIR